MQEASLHPHAKNLDLPHSLRNATIILQHSIATLRTKLRDSSGQMMPGLMEKQLQETEQPCQSQ